MQRVKYVVTEENVIFLRIRCYFKKALKTINKFE